MVLRYYIHDSGTHAGSLAPIWGGVLGTETQFEKLEREWNALLAKPMNGHGRLRKFHRSSCKAGKGQFIHYNGAEIDRVQWKFRQIVKNSGVVLIAYATDARAWDEIIDPVIKDAIGEAEAASFACCIKRASEIASVQLDGCVKIVVDKGGMKPRFTMYHFAASNRFGIDLSDCPIIELPVVGSPSLQAADLVAGYFYEYVQKWLFNSDAKMGGHFKDLVGDESRVEYGVLSREEIKHLHRKMAPTVSELSSQSG